MGDSWHHQVVVEKVGADSSYAEGAVCLSGERACPPFQVDDCAFIVAPAPGKIIGTMICAV